MPQWDSGSCQGPRDLNSDFASDLYEVSVLRPYDTLSSGPGIDVGVSPPRVPRIYNLSD